MRDKIKGLVYQFLQIANFPTDTQRQRHNKETLLLMSSHFTVVGLIWGLVYLSNGLWKSSCIPFSYTVLSAISIVILVITKKFVFFKNTQLCLVLVLPCLLHLSLGGFITSSCVILWAIVCPMAALFFVSIRRSYYWFGTYLVLIMLTHLLDRAWLRYDVFDISDTFIDTLFIMNVMGVSVLVVLVQLYFARSERSLKELVQKTNAELSRKHEALTVEQGKTKQILQKVENLFGQQVSLEVAKELISQDNDFVGRNYVVTILFLDIRNFSKFADNKKPEEVAAFQNVFFGEILKIIRNHGGITNQILGDGVMAVFGAPVQNSTHILDAVKASYALLNKTNELNKLQKIPLTRIGIGLHTGPVVAGNIGNAFRKQYSLTGSTVNIASRIEQLNKMYDTQILVSEAIKTKVQHLGYPIMYLEDVLLRGIESNMKIYKLS